MHIHRSQNGKETGPIRLWLRCIPVQVTCWRHVDAVPTGVCVNAGHWMSIRAMNIVESMHRRYIAAMSSAAAERGAERVQQTSYFVFSFSLFLFLCRALDRLAISSAIELT